MTCVSVFHNVSEDASFGFNTVFRTGDQAPDGVRSIELKDGRHCWKDVASTPEERHELVFVFQYEDNSPRALRAKHCVGTADLALLEDAFQTFNVGTDELAAKYRARKLRSLSKGDVVVIDGQRAYSCDSVGWSPVVRNDLRVLPAREAECRVRSRFQFRPGEELNVTVPLPD